MSTDNKDLVDSSATNEGQNTYTDNSNHLSEAPITKRTETDS